MSTSRTRVAMLQAARALSLKIARARLPDDPAVDAEDIAQEAMLRLAAQDPVPANVDAWVTTVTRNLVTDRLRAHRRQQDHQLALDVDERRQERRAADAELRAFLAQGVPASVPLDRDTQARLLLQMAEILSPREVSVLLLLADGATHEQIAEELGYKNADSVKSTVRKIRGKLEGQLEAFRDDRGHPRAY